MSTTARTIDPEHQMLGDVEMVGRDRWEEIRHQLRWLARLPRLGRPRLWPRPRRPCPRRVHQRHRPYQRHRRFLGPGKVRLTQFKSQPKHTFHLHLKETEWRYNHRRADKYKCLLQYLRKNPLS